MLPWLGLALIILIADQFTKVLILGYYKLGDATTITSFFNIVARTTPAPPSFLAAASGWQRWLFTGIGIVATLFIVYLLRTHAGQKLFSFALACILGGAIGNVIDRPAARLRGGLPAVPLAEPLVLPGLQRGRCGDHGRRRLPDPRRAAAGARSR